jgi:uncharacterized glyoxalase superfamily protein PhnB
MELLGVRQTMGRLMWTARFGMLVDKFAIPWMIYCDRPV